MHGWVMLLVTFGFVLNGMQLEMLLCVVIYNDNSLSVYYELSVFVMLWLEVTNT